MSLTKDLRRLIPQGNGSRRLGPAKVREPISAGRSVGRRGGAAASPQSGGGIDSPLTERAETREYHPEETITSSDGLFVIQQKPYAKIVTDDYFNREVVLNLRTAAEADKT